MDLRLSIGRALFRKGPAVLVSVASALKHGDNFVDVGANVGYYGIRALEWVGESGAVHASRLMGVRCAAWDRRIQTVRYVNLRLHEIAVTDEDGTARLRSHEEAGHSSVEKGDLGPTVPTTILDSWRHR